MDRIQFVISTLWTNFPAAWETGMIVDQDEDRPNLSPREREVLELIARGLSAKQVAHEISLAPRTVERHIENIRNKLRARNRAHLITKALACGELSLVGYDGLPFERTENLSMFQTEALVRKN